MDVNFGFIIIVTLVYASGAAKIDSLEHTSDSTEAWTGKWFPEAPTTEKPKEVEVNTKKIRTMGIIDKCDDAKTNIEIDYNGDNSAYVCLTPRKRLQPSQRTQPLIEFENIPKAYEADHICINESITYDSEVPTFGPHRQLWPLYGEYMYVPPQRWLHSLEHGGIVGLYHPCADLTQIRLFKREIQKCLWRHVITPNKDLPADRPFALVAWGVRLRTAYADPALIRDFIKKNALNGPEKVSRNGQFKEHLTNPSKIVSDAKDTVLCPSTRFKV